MRTTFDQIIEATLHHEGGYNNDSKDRGGETRHGISKRAYPDIDIYNLTRDEAIEIYRRDYWKPSRAAEIPDHLRHMYFDCVVNHGLQQAVFLLQDAILSRKINVTRDGLIGPETISAARAVPALSLYTERVRFFCKIVERSPSQRRFLSGWLRRAAVIHFRL